MENNKNNKKVKNKKKRISASTLILFIILIAGMILLVYPSFSDLWNSVFQSRMIAAYDEAAEKLSEETKQAIIDEARQWNANLANKPDQWIMNEEELERYNEILDITGTGVMGYINVPMANINLPIYHTTEEKFLTTGAGHLENTSFPVGGESTHACISGHRGLPSARLFTDLDKLNEGDVFQITVLNEKFTYEIDKISIVLPEDVELLEIEDGSDYCTLITCTPYAVNTHRLLLRGHRVSNYLFDRETIPGDANKYEAVVIAPLVALPILLILLIILLITTRKPKKKGVGENENENEKDD